MELNLTVGSDDDGQRAVDVLVKRTQMSRLLSKKIRLYGELLCNGQPHRMIDPVHAGDTLTARYQPHGERPASFNPVTGVKVLYQDAWLALITKPPGMVTHPSWQHDQDALTSLLSDRPLHPVNRLDRDTSGLVLLAMNGHAHHVLSRQTIRKYYVALLHGRLPAPAGLIRAPIRRASGSIMLREVHPDGAAALTQWQELRYDPRTDVSLVRYQLLTGRTHQLRLHSMACGCPIVGDTLYTGGRQPDHCDRIIGRQALHALSMTLTHPVNGRPLHIRAPLPEDFAALLRRIWPNRPCRPD